MSLLTGDIYLGVNVISSEEVAMKLESVKAKHPSLSMSRRSSRHSLAVLACLSSDGSEQNPTSHGPPSSFAG